MLIIISFSFAQDSLSGKNEVNPSSQINKSPVFVNCFKNNKTNDYANNHLGFLLLRINR
jgi:hypothetical protein